MTNRSTPLSDCQGGRTVQPEGVPPESTSPDGQRMRSARTEAVDCAARVPFLLRPTGKDYLWGGRRLRDDFAKDLPLDPLAETWECSTHPDGPCYAASGPFAGRTLAEILREHPAFLGTHPEGGEARADSGENCAGSGEARTDSGENCAGSGEVRTDSGEDRTDSGKDRTDRRGELPVLIKFIDAKQDLSVQVHPDDGFARKYENGQRGKTEFWYVLDAAKDAKLVYGLSRTLTAEQLRESVEAGTLTRYLQTVPVRPGDLFYVKAGTIHAIGAGCLIAEIQQSSNLTYRLYDYGRTDKQGRRRELHIEKALRAANLRASPEPRPPIRLLRYRPGAASELLARCAYFQVNRILLNTERLRRPVSFRADGSSFRALLCVRGCGCLFLDGLPERTGETALPIYRGDCIFVPADSVPFRLHGRMELLDVRG